MTLRVIGCLETKMELPKDVLKTIRSYASDKYEPTPTARLINTLNFEYKEASKLGLVYRPYRLEVTTQDQFTWIDYTHPEPAHLWSVPKRTYVIRDFLDDSWSEYTWWI